ncbi:hypothetical protein RB195_017920 [Necator americanus]|uniref:Reverse transcriptase domain-containing protein n=1 Tax=Necator americanus TaxID=51031 RepID=A0ABR1C7B8_NECAM
MSRRLKTVLLDRLDFPLENPRRGRSRKEMPKQWTHSYWKRRPQGFVNMFSSFFSQVKEGLAAASEPAPPNPPPQAPPSKPAQSEQGENSGGDFLGGLLNVAKEVGQAINEKNQPPPPPPPEPKATDLIGGLLNVVGQAVNEKSQPPPPPPPPPEPKPTDLLGGILNAVGQAINEKNQPPPPPPPPPEPTGADLLGGLLNVVGNAMSDKKEPEVKPPPPTPEKQESGSKITQEDIAMITKGLGALVTSIKEKTATKDVEEEQVAKVDSQGGKVQISSVASTNDVPASQQEQTTSAGGDFFSGLMGMAKEVGKAMNEPKGNNNGYQNGKGLGWRSARTPASEAAIEDLMMQAKKIKYDVIGLTETRRRHPLNAVYETGEELFLGSCDSRGVGGVVVLVNTRTAKNIDFFEQLTTRIGRMWMRRCGPIPALTIFVAYAPTSSYEEEEVEAFYMDLEKFYREDHAFYKVIIGDFNAKVGPRRTPEELHIGTHGLQWNDERERLSEFIMTTKTIHGNSQFQKPSSLRWTWESPGGGYRNEIDHIIVNKRFCLTDVGVVPKFYTGSDHRLLRGRFSFTRRAEKAAKFRERNPRTTINWDLFATLAGFWEDSAMDNIDEEYDRLIEHLHDCAKKAESFKTTKRRLSLETLELIRQRGAARAAGNQELTSELARLCREAIKEDLKERRAEVLAEAAEAGKSIRYARRDFATSRRGMEKIIYDFYSDLFDSHVHLPPHHLREDGQVIPEVLPFEIRHAIMSVRNRTAPDPDRIRPEHLKSLLPVLINTLVRLFTRYLSECKVPKQWKTSKTVLLYKKGDPHDIGNYRPICLLSVIYKLFTRVILDRIEKVLDEGQPCEQAGFRKGFSTIDHIHTVSKLIEVSREYKMPLCLTFIDLKKAFDSVETEAVVEALDNQGVPTQYIKVLRELYSNFTTGISPFYKNIIINVKRRGRHGDTISLKIFISTVENAMQKLEWDYVGVKVDGRQLHHLRFADDIVLITRSISQAERMLTEFDETCGRIGLQLNLQKTMFMRNGWVSDAPFTLNGTYISECTSYVYLGRELNMMNDLRAGQKETSGLGSVQEHRGCSEEDQEHPAPCAPLQHHRTSCFDLCFGNLGISQAGRKRAPPPQQTSHLSQEDIAKITQGLSALVGKAFNKGAAEGEVAQVDSQGGKTSAPADNDFLSGLLNMAKDVGKKLGDQPGAQQSAQASSNAAGNQGSKVTQEDIGKLVLALGPLVNTIKEKTFAKKEEAEKEVGKVDSQGGKVQLSSVQGPTDTTKPAAEQPAQAPAGGDFLSGLMSVAKDVGKAMNEQQQPQAANGQQLSQEDVAKITAGLGFLGTLIKDKAGDIFQKPAAEEKEKEKEKPKEEPVIDEVEGEIGKVVLSGYTAQTIATKSKNE